MFDRNGLDGMSAILGSGENNFISYSRINNNLTRSNLGDGGFISLQASMVTATTPISGNRSDRNDGDGIEVLGTGYDLSGNRADGNGGAGINAPGNDDLGGNSGGRNASCNTPGCF